MNVGDVAMVPRKDGSFTLARLDPGNVLQPILEVTPAASDVPSEVIQGYVQSVLEFLNFKRTTEASGARVQLTAIS